LPRTKEQNEELRSQRMETILQSALKVYVEQGFAAADIGDVAERAGVARGLIYYYFKDKRTLFRSLFAQMLDRSNLHITNHFNQDVTFPILFEQFITQMYNNMFEQSDYVLFFFRMRHDLHTLFTPEELKRQKWKSDNMSVFTEAIRKAIVRSEIRNIAPALLAGQLWAALMHGMIYLYQRTQELNQLGISKREIKKRMEQEKCDAIATCIAMLKIEVLHN